MWTYMQKQYHYATVGRAKIVGRNKKGRYNPRSLGDLEASKLPKRRGMYGTWPQKHKWLIT
jgi:hypothetical protein